VTFTPAVLGARAAAVTIQTNDAANPVLTVSLTGNGVIPVLTVTPTTLTFGTQLVNNTSPAQLVNVANTGTAPLSIGSIVLGGTNPSQFGLVNGCGTSLAAGASCTVSVTFRPTTAGPQGALLAVNVAAPAVSQVVTLTGVGSALNASTTALSFGNQTVNTQSAASTVTLTNNGTTAITMAPAALTGANAGDFTFTTTCGASLAAGASCRYTLRFRPTAIGPRSAALSISNSDVAGPQAIALSGNGVAPGVVLSPSALTFSSALNVTSAAQTVTLTNSGTATLTINNVTLGGTNPNQFARVNGCGATLAVGASCTISVTFRPTTANPATKNATLTVNVAAPAVSQTATLTGTVVVPAYTVSPAAVDFGLVPLNTTSAAQLVTVINTGTAALTINNPTLGGTNPNQFARVNGCGATLAAGASCTISVTSRPTTANPATKNATLTVNVAAPAVSQTVTLTGGVAVPTFTVSPTALAFGNQARNTTSAARSVTVTNTGVAALTINNVALGGTNPGQFNRVNGCPASLTAGSSCTVSVTFRPTSAGPKAAVLNVTVAAPATSQAVPLSGTGL
jgi:hypothetical protein